ncbi:30S ribosomal protein S13 [candidate division WOR-1 bacterium RIFCSPHIGHO2_01_FULL_53_15]|uniref:Small ribosomal subunit protein uS13 n=1 Tax=candidate division WOR-1 bacterium RIFCSPHIGHO2_01_FULL_53_15 TaxID=1802564 RepID=A0A1F4Q3W1_UNCSA|nr:MAG: 30S ribosomal protein S13 [candidate division WOR-1 bacterium RIFCSPHIGHO2_01_FULL_53_15]OGC12493.1 MAG: 30S ribosomal protein S13 [candidate division WOR-1 bacterium RIFCSPHIGHO2_02_FULL_53_26]
MVRLAGVDLPPNKRVDVGLTYIYGVGEAVSKQLLAKAGLNPAKRVKDLNDNDLLALRDALKDFKVEGDLRREVSMSIKRLIDTGTYRGTRHRKGLPARGQRTRTNARTLRGKRKTVGLGKKKEEEKKE